MANVVNNGRSSSYSFTLEKGKQVWLQHGTGFPDRSQKIVVNDSNTILLRKKEKRVAVKRSFMSTAVNIKVE